MAPASEDIWVSKDWAVERAVGKEEWKAEIWGAGACQSVTFPLDI